MKPSTFEEVCAMDFQPRKTQSPKAAQRRSGQHTRTVGYDSLQSLKTTAEQSPRWIKRAHTRQDRLSQAFDLSLQASNPFLRQTTMLLRSTAADSATQQNEAMHILDSALDDSITALQCLEARYSKIVEQKRVGAISIRSMEQERSQAAEVTKLLGEVQELRAESRHLSILEAELKLARSARPWVSELPEGAFACEHCIVRVKSAALCRVVFGHTLGLNTESAEKVSILHAAYKKTPRGGLSSEPVVDEQHHQEVRQVLERQSMLQRPVPREELMVPDLPWLRTVAPYMRKEGQDVVVLPIEILRQPPATLALDYAYNYTGGHGHRNLRHLCTGELLFSAGAVCVVMDIASRKQRHFRGHSDLVLSIAVFPLESGGLVASGQIGDNPVVCLWNTRTMQELQRLRGTEASPDMRPLMLPRSAVSLAFSPNGRLLAAVGDDDDCTIAVHQNQALGDLVWSWQSSEVFDVCKCAGGRILCLDFNPFAETLVTCGVRHVRFWELKGGRMEGAEGEMGCESQTETFLSLAFVDAETTITGLESGMIWIWKGMRAMKTVSMAHNGPVFDIAVDGYTAISGGGDGKLCLWNFAKDFRLVPPGDVVRGEMLVKEIEVSSALAASHAAPGWLDQLQVGAIRSVSWHGHRVAVGTSHNHLLVVDDNVGTGQLVLAGHHRGGLAGLAMHPRLPWMFTCGGEGSVLMWDLDRREVVAARNYETQRATRKKVEDGRSKKREAEEEEEEDTAPWKRRRARDWRVGLTSIDVSPDGMYIAGGQDDGGFFVQRIEYEEGRVLALKDLFAVMPSTPQRAVSQLRFSPDMEHIAVGLETGIVRLYALSDLIHAEPKAIVCRVRAAVRHMDWDRAGVVLRCNDDQAQLSYLDARDGSVLQRKAPVRAARGGDREVRESPWASLSCPLAWQTHGLYLADHNTGDVAAVASSPSKALMAAGDVYGKVLLGRNPCLSEAAGLEQQGGHAEEVRCLGFTNKSHTLLSGGGPAASVLSWRIVPSEPEAAPHTTADKDEEVAGPKPVTEGPDEASVLRVQVCGADPPAWSTDFGWTDSDDQLRRILQRRPLAPPARRQVTADPFPEPWRLNCLPPMGVEDREEEHTGDGCEFEAELQRVTGFNGVGQRGNVVSLLSGETVYPAGTICVLASAGGDQRFFRGHLHPVTALAVHPNGGLVASGDGGKDASVLIWDSGGGQWTGKTLYVADAYLRGLHENGVVALSFSGDGTLLLSLGGDGEHSLMVHRWEDEPPSLVCKVSGGTQPVLAACFNPYSDDVVSCGVGHVRFWSLTSKGLEAAESGVGEEFLEWAVTQEACCSIRKEAAQLGDALLQRTNVSAAFLDDETAATGSVDGRILLWKRRQLQSADKGHSGPVFDLDSARGRGLFRGTLVITMAGARKDVVSLLSQGARSEEQRQLLADAAMERWQEEETRARVRPPKVKSAVVSWSAVESGGIASCGGKEVKLWGWELELCVGFAGFALSEGFERCSTVGRGRHKWRPRSMSLQEFLTFLRGVGLLFDPHKPLAHADARDAKEGPSHPMVNSVEATQAFVSAGMEEVGMEEFVQMMGQIVEAIAIKEQGDTVHGNRRGKLEMDLVDLEGHLSDLERTSVGSEEDFRHRILQVREEIKSVALQLKAMRVFIRRVLRVQDTYAVTSESDDVKESGHDCAIALFHCHDRRMLVGSASDNVYEIHLDTAKSRPVAGGHGGVPLLAVCVVSDTRIAVSEAGGTGVHIWDVESSSTVFSGRFRSAVTAMEVLQKRCVMAVGLQDGSVYVVDVAEGLPALCAVRVGRKSTVGVCCVRFSPEGGRIAAAMEDCSVHLLRAEEDASGQDKFAKLRSIASCKGHAGRVTAMDWTENGKCLRSESRDGSDLLFWSADGNSITAQAVRDAVWASGSCTFAWGARPLHRHTATASPVLNSAVAPAVGHRVHQISTVTHHSMRGDVAGGSGQAGRIIDLAEGGWFMVAWESGEVSIPEAPCRLEYPGEDLCAVSVSSSLLIGWGSAGTVMLQEVREGARGIQHCTAHSGLVAGAVLLRSGGTMVSVGAQDRTVLEWSCRRRHRKGPGLYLDLERVLRAGAVGTAAALLAGLESFAGRYFGMESTPPPAAETKAAHYRLVHLFRVICGARPLHRKLLVLAHPEPTPPAPKFVGRSPIRRSREAAMRPKTSNSTNTSAVPQMPSKKPSVRVHQHIAAAHAAKLDRESRIARFRASVFLPVGHGRKEGPPKVLHLRFGPLHVEGGVLRVREAKTIFATLDRDGRGKLSHSDFISGLRKFPRFASRLGLPTTIRQGDGSMDAYLRTVGEIDTNASKTIELEEFLTYFCRDKEDEVVQARVFRIENRPWSYSEDVVSRPSGTSTPMIISGREPRRRRTRERGQGPAVSAGSVSLSDGEMEALLELLGFSRSGPVSYHAFVTSVLASPQATAFLRAKGVRPEQCAALYCFRFKGGEEWVQWRPEELQVALYRPSWELSWIHRRRLPARQAWLLFKRLDPSLAALRFHSLPPGQRAAVSFETLFAGLVAFPDMAEALSLDAVLQLPTQQAQLRTFRLLFGEQEASVDAGRELDLEGFVSLFSAEPLPPPEGALLLPSIDNLEHSRRFNLSPKEARNVFRQLAACKSAAQDRSVLRHADFLHGLRTFPALATLLGLPERIGPSGGGLARYQILVGQIFQNKRAISEDDFARFFDPRGRAQAWKQHVTVLMVTDGEEDEHKTPPPSPKKRDRSNAHVGTREFESDPEVFPEKANLEMQPGRSRSLEELATVCSCAESAVHLALAVLDLVRSPLIDMGLDMQERIAATLSRLALLCICPVPLRLTDVELVGGRATTALRKRFGTLL